MVGLGLSAVKFCSMLARLKGLAGRKWSFVADNGYRNHGALQGDFFNGIPSANQGRFFMRGFRGGDAMRVRATCRGGDAQEEIAFFQRRFAFTLIVEAWQFRQAWFFERQTWRPDAETGLFQKA